jgi:hypothetical protein
MIKDRSIIDLIEKLKLRIDFKQVEIVDYWDADLCAIGIKCEGRLVYLSSYNFANGTSDGYDYDFELLNERQVDKINVIKKATNVKEEQLIIDIQDFLEG